MDAPVSFIPELQRVPAFHRMIFFKKLDQFRYCLAWRDDSGQYGCPYIGHTALDQRIFEEKVMQVFIDHAVHPG